MASLHMASLSALATTTLRRLCAVGAGSIGDQLAGEPPNRYHPVAYFGSVMGRVEKHLWKDRRTNGVIYTAIGVSLGAGTGLTLRRLLGPNAATALMCTLCVAGRELRRVATDIAETTRLDDNGNRVFDVEQARAKLPQLVGRDPTDLDTEQISAAVIESVAENSVDAIIAPLFWAAVGGSGAVGAYRAINTMDAMVGYRNERYNNFGWASARLDDVANWVPARIFAAIVILQHPKKMGSILGLIRRDAHKHPSPNAGVAETAVAAAIGCELGGTLRYGDRVEHRPTLGQGRRPTPNDISKAVKISARAQGFRH